MLREKESGNERERRDRGRKEEREGGREREWRREMRLFIICMLTH